MGSWGHMVIGSWGHMVIESVGTGWVGGQLVDIPTVNTGGDCYQHKRGQPEFYQKATYKKIKFKKNLFEQIQYIKVKCDNTNHEQLI